MRGVWLVFKKEMLEFAKDRKTMFFTLALPLILYPVLFGVMGKMASREDRQARSSQTRVAIVDESKVLEPLLLSRADEFKLVPVPDGDAKQAIKDDKLEMLVTLEPSAAQDLAGHKTVQVDVLYNKVEKTGNVGMERLEKVLGELDKATIQHRLEQLGASKQLADPTEIHKYLVGGEEMMLAKFLGTMLPYILMLMLFAGSMSLGVYVTAGERERGTLITLLATGLPRHEIIWGKMLYVFAMGIAVSIINIASMSISMGGLFVPRLTERMTMNATVATAPGGATDAAGFSAGTSQASDTIAALGIDSAAAETAAFKDATADIAAQASGLAAVVNPTTVLLVLLLMIPLGLMFATLIITLGIQAKNSQEASTAMMPIALVVVFLSIFSMSPGIEKMGALPYIPIVNISLVIRKLFAQQASALDYAIAFLMTVGLAALMTYLSAKLLGRESAIFKST